MARAMKDSGIEWIGEIPTQWNAIKLKYLASIDPEKLQEDTDKDFSFEYIDIGSIGEFGSFIHLEKLTFQNAPTRARLIVKKDDIILSTVRTYLKAIAIIPKNNMFIASTGFAVIRVDQRNDPKYFFYQCLSEPIIQEIVSRSVGISYPAINNSQLKEIRYVVPPLTEQQAIAEYLDRKCSLIDSIMEKQKTVIEKLKLYKQSIITEAVTKGLDPNVKMKPSGIEWIGHVPENWVICRIKDVAELNPKFSDSFSFNNNDEVSFCPMECIGQGYMTPTISTIDRVKNGYTFFADGDIVMAKVTPCFENGNIAIADGLTNGIGFGSTELYVFRSKSVNRLFLFYFLQNNIFRERCISSMYGVGGLKRVPLDFISTYHLALPPVDEQRIIAESLTHRCLQIDTTISIKQNLIDKLTEYKKSLIYEYVTGKREVV